MPSASDATGNGRPEGLLAEASAGLRPIVTAVGGAARAVRSTGLEACSASVLAASSSRQDATVARRGMVCAVGAERPQIPKRDSSRKGGKARTEAECYFPNFTGPFAFSRRIFVSVRYSGILIIRQTHGTGAGLGARCLPRSLRSRACDRVSAIARRRSTRPLLAPHLISFRVRGWG